MVAIAITGCIACGKSLALREFRKLGAYCIDCDAIVSKLYKRPEIKKKLKATFGTSSKKALSRIVFRDNSKRRMLEAIIWPEVIKELKKACRKYKGTKQSLLVAEVPLLFEASLEHLFDFVITVRSSKKLQVERLMKKGLSKKEALLRINAQMPIEEKVKKADFVIDNSKEKGLVSKQVKEIFSKVSA